MRTRALALTVLVALAGCSRSVPDDCQRVIDKSTPVLRELADAAGRAPMPQAMLDQMLAECRARKPTDEPDVLFACLLAAADRDTIAYCWKQVLDSTGQPAELGTGSAAGSAR